MTSKQCNSCKNHICVKELDNRCYYISSYFMRKKNCPFYEHGEINEAHKELFECRGKEYPFTPLKEKI